VYDQHTFGHADKAQQALGREALKRHRAVVLIPRKPLISGLGYSVSLVVNGKTHAWNFTAAAAAQAASGAGSGQ